jgi:hypothetical protein
VDVTEERENPRNVVDSQCGYYDLCLAMMMGILFMAFGAVMYAFFAVSTNQTG